MLSDEMKDLLSILSLKRPDRSAGELELISEFIIPTGAKPDDFGNYILRIGAAPVLWSSHTDTVHFDQDTKTQKLLYDPASEYLMAEHSECLGADNGAGVWIMLRMIAANVEGLYVFHRKEETGGYGSKFISNQTPTILEGIKFAIAFDRRGQTSIITHQGTRTCSDDFADQLSLSIGMDHIKDDGGTFTDTANYAHLIPECTNVSAGFQNEHRHSEYVDLAYLHALMLRMIAIDTSTWIAKREFTDNDYPAGYGYHWMSNRPNDHEKMPLDQDASIDLIRDNPAAVFHILSSWGLMGDLIDDMWRVGY